MNSGDSTTGAVWRSSEGGATENNIANAGTRDIRTFRYSVPPRCVTDANIVTFCRDCSVCWTGYDERTMYGEMCI
jgi:hypothetical protein